MDQVIEPQAMADVQKVLLAFDKPPVRIDHLITRNSGQRRFVDVHLHVPANWTLGRAAQVRSSLEKALIAAVPDLRATIQLLPSDVEPLIDDALDLFNNQPPRQ